MDTRKKIIKDYYLSNPGSMLNLDEVSKMAGLGRARTCALARSMGLTDKKRQKRSVLRGPSNPRWKGDGVGSMGTARQRTRNAYKELGACEKCDNPAVDRHHRDNNPLNNDRSNISFLCRRCHMLEDGRLSKLGSHPRAISPPKPCRICEQPYKPLRKGRCHPCDMYFRLRGTERSAYLERLSREELASQDL